MKTYVDFIRLSNKSKLFPASGNTGAQNRESLKVLLRAPNPVALSYVDKPSCAYNLAPR